MDLGNHLTYACTVMCLCVLGFPAAANGNQFEGNWHGDMKNGPGRYFYTENQSYYEGEWVDDIPRAGTYKSATETTNLPELQLKDPDTVIDESISSARKSIIERSEDEEKGSVQHMPTVTHLAATCGLNIDEVCELYDAWQYGLQHIQQQSLDETLPADIRVLGEVLGYLSLEPTNEEVVLLLHEMGVEVDSEARPLPNQYLTFESFAKCMSRHRDSGDE